MRTKKSVLHARTILFCLSCMQDSVLAQPARQTRPICNCRCPGDLRCTNAVLHGHAVMKVYDSMGKGIKWHAAAGIGKVLWQGTVRLCWCWRRCSGCNLTVFDECNAGGLDGSAEKAKSCLPMMMSAHATLPMQFPVPFASMCFSFCTASEAASTNKT